MRTRRVELPAPGLLSVPGARAPRAERDQSPSTAPPELMFDPRGELPDGDRRSEAPVGVTPKVTVVIPTLNEVESLPWVIEHLPEWVSELVIVDGLSTDRTENLARSLRPDVVVVHQYQRGKGAALRAGFAAATGDIIVMIDADGSTDPREMDRFVQALVDGADFVKGSRHMQDGGSADFTWLRAAGNKLFVVAANSLYGSKFTDLCYGYCAFWRSHVDKLGLTADGFEIETQLVLGALKAGLEIREVPSFELERRAGTSNLNAARDGLRVLRTMVGRDERRPDEAIHFPVWSTSEVPEAGERRSVDRRIKSRELTGYIGPERRQSDERRETVGTVVAYRAVYGQARGSRASSFRPLPAASKAPSHEEAA
jgi:hypothetical protein